MTLTAVRAIPLCTWAYAGVALGALAAFGVGLWGYLALDAFLIRAEQRRRDADAVQKLELLVAAVREAESGQRGFLLTNDEAYLVSYDRGTKRARQLLAAGVVQGPWPAATARALGRDVCAKLDEMARTVELTRKRLRREAVAAVKTGWGRGLMWQIHAHADAMGSAARDRVRAQEARLEKWAYRALIAIPLVGVLAPLVVVASMGLGFAQYRVRVAAVADSRARELAAREAYERNAHLLNALSHDLRYPLNSIAQQASLAAMRPDLASGAVDQVRRIAAGASDMLEGFLDVARAEREEPKIEAFPLGTVLAGIGVATRPLATAKGLELNVVCPPGLVIRSDRRMLHRVVQNLVSNAVKFTKLGSVTVEAHPCRGPGCGDNGILIRVADTGPGIAADLLPKLFHDFVQGHNSERDAAKGFGLGLSIARRLALRLGGDIEVQSDDGRGSVFVVRVPGNAPVA